MRHPDQMIYNFLIANGIANTPAYNDAAIQAWGLNLINVYEHYNSYLQNVLAHDAPGPIEKHPYLDTYEADFDLQHGGFLLLGTFPPSSYFNNLQLANLPNPNIQNNIPTHYFYGNTAALWDYLFGLQGPALTIPAIRAALKKHKISISDVFSYAQRRVMRKADDAQYRNIVLNCRISEVFQPSSTIHTLLFTSGSLRTFLGNNTSALTGFRWILEDCLHGLEYFSISGSKMEMAHTILLTHRVFRRLYYNKKAALFGGCDQNPRKFELSICLVLLAMLPYKCLTHLSSRNGLIIN